MSAANRIVKSPNKNILLVALLLGMAALMAAPGVMACKPGKGNCPLPNPAPQGSSKIAMVGENIHIESDLEMDCNTREGATAASGDYECTISDYEVHILTGGFTGDFNRKYWDLCHTFHHSTHDDAAMIVPDSVSYGWTDDCTNGSCAIEVRIDFSGDALYAKTGQQANELSVRMTGSWEPEYPENADNPFFGDDPAIDIDLVRLDFGNTGQKRLAAACTWKTTVSHKVYFVSTDTTTTP